MARPAHLIDINGVEGLDRLEVEGSVLSIGACVRHAAFHRPAFGGVTSRLLSFVSRHIAHYPIRTRGTFCGSLAHADPSSEWCLTAATLDATLVARSVKGERTIAADEFLQGIMSTALAENELLAEVRLPLLPDGSTYGFYEFSRRAGDFAMAAGLATYRLVDGIMTDVRLGVGGAEERARRIPEAENELNGKSPSATVFRAAADAAANAIEPLEDIQTTGEYRRDLVRAVTRRALERAAQ
jgi:aerobic carbon-monoxide dehydrogenase medium subunit